jgi:hypothetical protein
VRCGRCAGARLWTRVRVHRSQSQCTVLRRGARRQCDVAGRAIAGLWTRVRVHSAQSQCIVLRRSRARSCSAVWQMSGREAAVRCGRRAGSQTMDASAGAQIAGARLQAGVKGRHHELYAGAQRAVARLQCTVAGVWAPGYGRQARRGARLQCDVVGVRAPDCGRECGCADRGRGYATEEEHRCGGSPRAEPRGGGAVVVAVWPYGGRREGEVGQYARRHTTRSPQAKLRD